MVQYRGQASGALPEDGHLTHYQHKQGGAAGKTASLTQSGKNRLTLLQPSSPSRFLGLCCLPSVSRRVWMVVSLPEAGSSQRGSQSGEDKRRAEMSGPLMMWPIGHMFLWCTTPTPHKGDAGGAHIGSTSLHAMGHDCISNAMRSGSTSTGGHPGWQLYPSQLMQRQMSS